MISNKQGRLLSTAVAAALMLAGCGGGSSSGTETGLLSLGISDGPVHDAVKVCIAFDEIELKGDGAPFVVDPGGIQNINLLEFQGANAAPLLFNEELPAGHYQWLRLGVNAEMGGTGGTGDDAGSNLCTGDASYMTMEGGMTHNLYVPSGAQSGLKLVRGFTVPANGSADFTAEIDLMKSLTAPPGADPDVVFRPTIRLVNNVEVGTLVGEVSSDLATADACDPSVFVFDDGIAPNPIDTDSDDPEDPVATAMVNEQVEGNVTSYHYSVGFLLAGEYEVAFTCDGQTFEPADGKPATIEAQTVRTVDFP